MVIAKTRSTQKLARFLFAIVGAAIIAAIAVGSLRHTFAFDGKPLLLFHGRSPKFFLLEKDQLEMISTRPGPNAKGYDLFLQPSTGSGYEFGPPFRVNDVPGEVSDHGENSPQIVPSPDHQALYAAWGTIDPKESWGGSVRFARSVVIKRSFSPAITINDDHLPISYAGFQTLAVSPDGTIYIAWLDAREGVGGSHVIKSDGSEHDVADTSAIYLARSTDQGRTFGHNIRVAGNICPCCRPTIGFVGETVVIGFRLVEPGDIRDIYVVSSTDKGQTWSDPILVGRDNFKINGCPHVGPSIATLGGRLYVAWYTGAAGKATINLAFSDDNGKTFSPKRTVSEDTINATHPQLVSNGAKLGLVFQAQKVQGGSAPDSVGIFYREIYADGSMSRLIPAFEGSTSVTYPNVAFDESGILVSWTQTEEGEASAYLLRGRQLWSPKPRQW